MDRRVKRTRKRLKESLVEILKDKCVEDITVSELAEKADINRAPFTRTTAMQRISWKLLKENFLKRLINAFGRTPQEKDWKCCST